ncbi:MAG: Zn-ribbon domain-containing OB-fold protein [Trueperaceae bacterium]
MTSRVPAPQPTQLAQPFWDALLEQRILIQRCNSCGNLIHNPKIRCPNCHGADLGWANCPTSGRIYSYTVVHRPLNDAFADNVPYVIGLVELDEVKVRLMTNIVNCDEEALEIGERVNAVFPKVADDFTVFAFEPAMSGAYDGR